MYRPRFLEAFYHAWNTRVEQELARHERKRMGVVFLVAPNATNELRITQQLWRLTTQVAHGEIMNRVFSLYFGPDFCRLMEPSRHLAEETQDW